MKPDCGASVDCNQRRSSACLHWPGEASNRPHSNIELEWEQLKLIDWHIFSHLLDNLLLYILLHLFNSILSLTALTPFFTESSPL